MENKVFAVDINSIDKTKKIMEEKINELLSSIIKYKEIIDNTKNIYDTESAVLYRYVALGYIEMVEKYINNEFREYIDKLDDIKRTYIDEYNSILKNVRGDTK